MNITNDISGSAAVRNGSSAPAERATDPTRPPESDVRRFERLLARPDAESREAPRSGDRRLNDELDRATLHAQLHPGVPASTHGAPTIVSQGPEPISPAQLDELIARYVRQLAVSDPSAASDPRIMLKLDPGLLPDTELFLAKSAEGWVLQANARSPEACRFIAEHGPALEQRFRERRLGTLRIETSAADPIGASRR